jgi:hypothetical protein
LPQVGHFVPWVQNRLVLVCTRESQLDADAAVDRPLAFAALRPDSACLPRQTKFDLPEQAPQPSFFQCKFWSLPLLNSSTYGRIAK